MNAPTLDVLVPPILMWSVFLAIFAPMAEAAPWSPCGIRSITAIVTAP